MNETKISLFTVTKVMSKLTLKCCPKLYLMWCLSALFSSMLFGVGIIMTQQVFERATEIAQNQRPINEGLVAIALFALVLVLREVLNGVTNFGFVVMYNRMDGFMRKLVAEKIAKLAPIAFENPKTLDEINKATNAISAAFQSGSILIFLLAFYLPFFVVTAIYVYHLNPILILTIAFVFIPKIIAMFLKPALYAKLENEIAPIRREFEFYEQAIVDRQFFKETRILGIFSFFKEKYMDSLKMLNVETWHTDAKSATIDLTMSSLTIIGYLGVLYLLFTSLRDGAITIGAFAAVFGNIAMLIVMVDEVLSMHLSNAMRNLGSVGYLIRFFELPDRPAIEKTINWEGEIKLTNVSFQYPNTTQNALNNLNLTIKPKETLAIVGANGSGKSTLTKIITGLFEPTNGDVLIDGSKTKSVAPHLLFKDVTAVFQKFQRYQLSLQENIQLSDVAVENEVMSVIKKAGVDIESTSYPDDLGTILSREFDGVDLSGGQWQRVAIARGLYRQHSLIILDEPTAAIDPLEESRLYEKFSQLTKDKTAIIVTHRIASAQIADRLIVLDKGEIVEEGRHDQLLAADGLYAKMYNSQKSWYIASSSEKQKNFDTTRL